MTLIIYSTMTNAAKKRLLRLIELSLPEIKFKFYRTTVDDFSELLGKLVLNQRIVVLLAVSTKVLEDILFARELLEDAKIIQIVSDINPATLARGHTLRLRFLCDCNSDFADVAAVFLSHAQKTGARQADIDQ